MPLCPCWYFMKNDNMQTKTNDMETKEQYLEQAEIKVKNLMGYLYESESESLDEISKLKKRLNRRITELEEYVANLVKQQRELQDKFNALKASDQKNWQKASEELELHMKYVEGDRESFMQRAEIIISEMGNKIQELEDKAIDAASDTKKEIERRISELKSYREDLNDKINKLKNDTSEQWKDVKHWFVDRYNTVKQYMKTIV